MHIGPIWRALKRSKASYALIALQIAVTMAIIVNAIAIIQERSRLMSRPSGVDEANIFYLSSNAFISETDNRELIRADLERLRATFRPNVSLGRDISRDRAELGAAARGRLVYVHVSRGGRAVRRDRRRHLLRG